MKHLLWRSALTMVLTVWLCGAPAGAQQAAEEADPKASTNTPEASTSDTEIEKEAKEILTRWASALAKAPRFSVTVETGYDTVQPSGQKVEFGSTRKFTFLRPNQMRLDIENRDGSHRGFRFDGKTIGVFDVEEKVHATAEKPGTFEEAVNNTPNTLFALSELSFYYAKESGKREYYLAAAVYAFAFLFPDGAGVPPDPIDPRLRAACDLYSRGLTQGLLADDGEEVEVKAGVFPLPFGSLTVTFNDSQLHWASDRRLTDFVPAADLEIGGLNNRYRRPGIGAPLAASTVLLHSASHVNDFVAPKVKVPVNLFLRITQPRQGLASGQLRGELELRADTDADFVRVDDRDLPLEFDPTAALAYQLSESTLWTRELWGFFLGDLLRVEQATNLAALSPYRPGRIPVIFVHGTASSAARWADIYNDLWGDPRIRDNFQAWFFTYDTGNPIVYSAARLRQALRAVARQFDPEGKDPAMQRMVLMGHSQGGLLVKMMAIETGTKLWDTVSAVPLDQLKLSAQSRDMLQESLFVEPLPFVRRVIFMCTPHRGSYQAGGRIVHWVARFIKLPGDVLKAGTDILQGNADKLKLARTGLPTSIDNMTPSNRFIQTLATIPVAPGVAAHSIIAVQGDGPVEAGTDGVVKYESAHIDGVESEIVVNSGHSAQSNPGTVEEVRRILLRQATEVCTETGVACKRPFRVNDENTGADTRTQAQ
ncbi:MAG: alpha/beta fold hydrolase [Deltaproteobacteria bacterium]|nr:alpha/beta fold hydrolase [Deltaproteobacteria bacterium]